jgi:hypothetical protein
VSPCAPASLDRGEPRAPRQIQCAAHPVHQFGRSAQRGCDNTRFASTLEHSTPRAA